MDGCMDMDGWMDGCMDGWMEGKIADFISICLHFSLRSKQGLIVKGQLYPDHF